MTALAREGSVTIREMRDSGASGNAWAISGMAGATAAPPMRIIMAESGRNSTVQRSVETTGLSCLISLKISNYEEGAPGSSS